MKDWVFRGSPFQQSLNSILCLSSKKFLLRCSLIAAVKECPQIWYTLGRYYYFCNKLSLTQWLQNIKLLSYSSGYQKSRISLKIKVVTGLVPSGGSRGKPISLSFLISGGHLHFLAHGSIFHLQSQQHSIFQSLSTSIIFLFLL